MNKHLKSCYIKFDRFLERQSDTSKLTNPLYINYDDKSENKMKVMFFGQETYDWEGLCRSTSIDKMLEVYDEFYIKGNCFKNRGGSFWNEFKHFSLRLREKFSDKDIETYWNNIIKVGKYNDKGHPDIKSVESIIKYPIILEELDTINPDIIIFYTGPNYDKFIDVIFKSPEYKQVNEAFSIHELARIVSPHLPANTFRTFHPQGLNFKGREYKERVRKAILNCL